LPAASKGHTGNQYSAQSVWSFYLLLVKTGRMPKEPGPSLPATGDLQKVNSLQIPPLEGWNGIA
jgi:hypothetical protein